MSSLCVCVYYMCVHIYTHYYYAHFLDEKSKSSTNNSFTQLKLEHRIYTSFTAEAFNLPTIYLSKKKEKWAETLETALNFRLQTAS